MTSPLIPDWKKALWAVRGAYFMSGFAIASWAPMIPYVKEKLQLAPDVLGLVLLCLGFAAFLIMPFNGIFIKHLGCRGALRLSAALLIGILAILPILPNMWCYGAALFVFGAGFGITDVSMNLNAMVLEKESGSRIMSVTNACYSIGNLAGAALFSALAYVGLPLMYIAWLHDGLLILLVLVFFPHLLPFHGEPEKHALFAAPKGIVLLLGVMAFISYLAEGAVMDWSGVILTSEKGAAFSEASMGFAVFSAAMLVLRLLGDRLIGAIGERNGILFGALITAVGFLGVDLAGNMTLALAFFAMIGVGAANIVPALCSLLAKQKDMPLDTAVTAFNSMGYTGVLLGPAFLGFIGEHAGLVAIFYFIAFLFVLQAMGALVKLGVRSEE